MKSTLIALLIFLAACNAGDVQQHSDSGVAKATVQVHTDVNGQTIEQRNIIDRLKRDNEIGSIKHLYIVSSYTGDVLQYSTVKGKVTSGGKRLSPKSVNGATNIGMGRINYVQIGTETFSTDEVLDDGGAYGESGNYLFWFDANGNYQQYYPSGGTYLHISDKPLRVKKTKFSLEMETEATQ